MSRSKASSFKPLFVIMSGIDDPDNREAALRAAKGDPCEDMSDYGNLENYFFSSEADAKEWLVDNGYNGIVFKMSPVSENTPRSVCEEFTPITDC